MWDTAGQERFASMASLYYRGADAAVLVFDCTVPKSLQSVRNWVKGIFVCIVLYLLINDYVILSLHSINANMYIYSELQEHVEVSEDIVLILAANKCDLSGANSKESKSLMSEAAEYAKEIGAKLWKTSAKASININEMFNDVAQSIYIIKTTNGSMLSDDEGNGQKLIFDDPRILKKGDVVVEMLINSAE